MTDKIFEFVTNSVREEERRVLKESYADKPKPFPQFHADRKAKDLIEPARKKARHHREREKHYTSKLEEAEKELREKGVSVEVFDSIAGTYLIPGNVASGSIGGQQQNFQPRVDQRLADAVKNAKNKMLEHRGKAEQYEKLGNAFSINPEFPVKLSIEDIHYFGLGEDTR